MRRAGTCCLVAVTMLVASTQAAGLMLRSSARVGDRSEKAHITDTKVVPRKHGTNATAVLLLGDRRIERSVDKDPSGMAEAFPFAGQHPGTASSISVFVTADSRAHKLVAALYAGQAGHPGSRLAAGSISSFKSGSWDRVHIPPTTIRPGAAYWVVLLARGGSLYLRYRADHTCGGSPSLEARIASTPMAWKKGWAKRGCPVSAYVSGVLGPTTQNVGTDGGNDGSATGGGGSSTGAPDASAGATDSSTPPASTPSGAPPATGPASGSVLPPANVTSPALSGSAVEGQTLSTTDGSWINDPTAYSYQWQDCDSLGLECVDISGATSSTYVLAASDVGETVRALVIAANSAGSTSAASPRTDVVSSAPPSNTAAPAISGTPMQGDTLTASTGTWTNSPTSYAYQWQDCDDSSCGNISGATSNSYTLQSSDVGDTVDVVVTASNAAGTASADSQPTSTVTPPPPSNTAAPAISGTPTEGDTLSASSGAWNNGPTSYAYQWQDCNSSGSSCTNIANATMSDYAVRASDVGDTIRVRVTASNASGSASARSAATSVVTAGTSPPPANTAAPVISGTPTEGDTLTTSTGSWSGNPSEYAYAWQDCDSTGANCTAISDATASSYTLTSSDVGYTIEVVVTATNSSGSSSAASAPTSVVTSSGSGTPTNCAVMGSNNQPEASRLDACGYPSPDTTGVPTGTALTPVASAQLPSGVSWKGGLLTISGSHVTVSGLMINGTVLITGSDDTLTDSEVVAGGGDDLVAIDGTSGNTISNDTIEGINDTDDSDYCGRAVHQEGGGPVTVQGIYVINCADGVVGVQYTSDSYIFVNVIYCAPGATGAACSHDEPIYLPGGNGSVSQSVQDNTLLNAMDEVAGVFGDDHAYGPLSNVTVNGNLVAVEGDNGAISTGQPNDGNTNIVITNNRLSYIYSANMPQGDSNPATTTWTNNYRDDNLKPVPISS
jgi:hypothetical protein